MSFLVKFYDYKRQSFNIFPKFQEKNSIHLTFLTDTLKFHDNLRFYFKYFIHFYTRRLKIAYLFTLYLSLCLFVTTFIHQKSGRKSFRQILTKELVKLTTGEFVLINKIYFSMNILKHFFLKRSFHSFFYFIRLCRNIIWFLMIKIFLK